MGDRAAASNVSLMSFTDGGGTIRWMSPELLDPDRFGISDSRPTKQSDCYALGMIVYEVRADAIFPYFPLSQRFDLCTTRFFVETLLIGKPRMKQR